MTYIYGERNLVLEFALIIHGIVWYGIWKRLEYKACKMTKFEGMKLNSELYIQLIQTVYGQKVLPQYRDTIFQNSVQARLSVLTDWISSMFFGAILSSSILRAHLYTTPLSMV